MYILLGVYIMVIVPASSSTRATVVRIDRRTSMRRYPAVS